jgi:hypothetical protein
MILPQLYININYCLVITVTLILPLTTRGFFVKSPLDPKKLLIAPPVVITRHLVYN